MAVNPSPDLLSCHAAQKRTTDGVIGTSGRPTLVFGITLTAGSATGTVAAYSGTSTGGTLVESLSTAANTSVATFYGNDGDYYDGGVYLDLGGTGVEVSVIYNQ